MIKVEKRNSTIDKQNIVDFDIDKIKIAVSKAYSDVAGDISQESAHSIDLLIKRVAREINKTELEVIHVEEIQDIVEKALIKSNWSDVAKSYILYREERKRIRESNTRLIKSISEITFTDAEINDSKKENANIDGNTSMGLMLQYGSSVAEEFSKTHILNPEHSYLHKNGDIHIHDLNFYSMGTTTCSQIDLEKLFNNGFSTGHGTIRVPNEITSYSALSAIVIQANQNDQHGGQSIPAYDYYVAPGVLKTFRKLFKANIIKYLELNFDLEEIKSEELASMILESYGEINSIEFSIEQREKFGEIISNIPKLIDYDYEKMLRYLLRVTTKETDRLTFQAMEALIFNLNTMHSRAGAQVPFSSINFGTDISPEGRMVSKNLLLAQERGLGNGETAMFPITIFKVKDGINLNQGDINYDLFKLACRVSAKRLFPNFSFIDAPFNKAFYKEGDFNTEVAYMGCRSRVMSNVNGEEIATGRGNNSFTSLNLVRLGIECGTITGDREVADMDLFYSKLDNLIDITIEQLLERYKYQINKQVKNFPFLMGQGVWNGSEELSKNDTLENAIKNGSLAIGFIGLAETLVSLIGKHHGESLEAQKLGLEIIGHMRKRCDEYAEKYKLNFSLIATPAEGLSGRFIKIDRKRFGELEGVTDREYYTNSFHVPVYYKTSAFDKLNTEAPYHDLTNGGHISYIEVDGDASDNLEAFEEIVRYMSQIGIGYGSINHPVDSDTECGYTGIIKDVCPKCGRTEGDIPFQRIRRITGYLAELGKSFNNAKANEEKDRVKHGI